MIAKQGLVGELKHLMIEPYRPITDLGRLDMEKAYRGAEIGRIFAVPFHFRVKCELTFMMVPPAYEPILDRITKIVKANMSRDEIDKYFASSCSDSYHDKYFEETTKLFSEDIVILELMDRFENMLLDETETIVKYVEDNSVQEYALDFSE